MPEKKTSAAQLRAVAKFQKEKTDAIVIRVPKGEKAFYKAASDIHFKDSPDPSGKSSLTQFIIEAMEEKIDNEDLRNRAKRKLSKQQKP